MWEGKLQIENEEAMEEFFNNISTELITEKEANKVREVVEEADTVSWPMQFVFEIEDDTWEEFSRENPSDAKVIEQHLEHN